MLHHEVWLDEAHHWLIARDSSSISELIHNARYEGHPILMDLILYFVSCISKDVMAMQITHFLIAALAAFLFLRYSPFSIFQKIVIIFGYYFLFEYNLINRNYSISWLFLVLLCIQFTSDKRNYALILLSLIMLSNTHLFSLICSIPFFILLIKEMNQDNKPVKTKTSYFILYLIGLCIAASQIIPPPDSGFIKITLNDSSLIDRFFRSLSFYFKGIICLPDYTNYNFWNTNYIITNLKPIAYLLSFIVITLPLLLFNKKMSLVIFYLSTAGIATLMFILPLTVGARYMGYSYMMFLVSLWFDKSYKRNSESFSLIKIKYKEGLRNSILWIILLIQTFSGIAAYSMDYRFPFSEGKNVADYIKSNTSRQPGNIVVMPMFAGPSVAAYLHEKLYYPECNNYRTFLNWNSTVITDNHEIVKKIIQSLNDVKKPKGKVVLALAYSREEMLTIENELKTYLKPDYNIINIKYFNNSFVKSENYTVYYLESN
jgi:hypothetical protein